MSDQSVTVTTKHRVVSREAWEKARKSHLAREKEYTRLRDQIAAERRALPWVKVDKAYVFETTDGKRTLADLFGRNSQLIVQHFMWLADEEIGCSGCSIMADHIEGALAHLQNHDVSFVRIARGPVEKLAGYYSRMGWRAPWASSLGSDFNFDYHVSFTKEELAAGKVKYNYEMADGWDELPGMSVFYKDERGDIYHTYSCYARGNEDAVGAFVFLDMTPKGRNETTIMDWVKRHDEYDAPLQANACCQS